MPDPATDWKDLACDRPSASWYPAWQAAVRAAVAEPGFPREMFARLIWERRADVRARELEPDPALKARRTVMSSRDIESCVIWSLGSELLAAPDAFRTALESRDSHAEAVDALARSGSAGRDYIPFLLGRVDELRDGGRYFHREAVALGRIAAGDRTLLRHVAERLASPEVGVRSAAAEALTQVGTDTDGFGAELIDLLLRRIDLADPGEWHHLVAGTASVGRDDPAARARLMALAQPAAELPASLSPDGATWCRGSVIEALRFLGAHPGECMPTLAAAVDDFEDQDPDWSYSGPVARVAMTIEAFGAGGASAASALARRLWNPGADYPKAILHALGAMGPAAAHVLPALLEERQKELAEEPLRAGDPDVNSREYDTLGWTIARLQGDL